MALVLHLVPDDGKDIAIIACLSQYPEKGFLMSALAETQFGYIEDVQPGPEALMAMGRVGLLDPGSRLELTPTQRDVLELTSTGVSVTQVAEGLSSGMEEVKTTMDGIQWNYGTTNMAAAIHRAILHGDLIVVREANTSVTLSPDQQKLARLIVSGRNNGQIARHFGWDRKEFEAASGQLFSLTGASGRNNCVRRLHELGVDLNTRV